MATVRRPANLSKRVALAVTGGIAAYKAIEVLRGLQRAGPGENIGTTTHVGDRCHRPRGRGCSCNGPDLRSELSRLHEGVRRSHLFRVPVRVDGAVPREHAGPIGRVRR